MIPITFVTTNPGKLREAAQWLGVPIEGAGLELEELQTTDLERLVRHKTEQARRLVAGPLVVEDTALVFAAWGELPGPFIKFFIEQLGPAKLSRALEPSGDNRALAICGVGYWDGTRTHFFAGWVAGAIVPPRGELGFGFDPIFQPENAAKTLGEMPPEEKQEYSMRARALQDLAGFLAGEKPPG